MSSKKHEHDDDFEHEAQSKPKPKHGKADLAAEADKLLEGVPAYREYLVNAGVHVDRIVGYDHAVDVLRNAKTDDELEDAIEAYKLATK